MSITWFYGLHLFWRNHVLPSFSFKMSFTDKPNSTIWGPAGNTHHQVSAMLTEAPVLQALSNVFNGICLDPHGKQSVWGPRPCVLQVCPPSVLSVNTSVSQLFQLFHVNIPWPQRNCRVTSVFRTRRFLRAVTVTVGFIHGLKTTVTTKENGNCVTERKSA